ncbi:MAG: nucleoside-diphosphate-sugar epimerase [Phycisphaerales bacterium]|jgi:nucleoside-diphosphate-sugar epimerase
MRLPKDIVDRLRPAFDGTSVCVTGGCGFIGGHLVDTLLSLGASITVIDDCSSSTTEHLASLIDLEPTRVQFVRASILDPRGLAEAMEDGGGDGGGARYVFHLAAIGSVPRSIEDPDRSWAVNATGTQRVLQAARAAGAKRVVYSASSSAYGNAPELPASTPKLESMPTSPESPYAASKLAGEALCRAWSVSYGLSTACLRYFNIFGPRQPADSAYAAVIPAVADRLMKGEAPVVYGDGEQSRDFTPVANAVLANLLAASAERELAGEVMNIGVGTRATVNELVSKLTAKLEARSQHTRHEPERAGDVRHSQADIARAHELIGYTPVVGFDEGLDEAAAWYRQTAIGEGAS